MSTINLLYISTHQFILIVCFIYNYLNYYYINLLLKLKNKFKKILINNIIYTTNTYIKMSIYIHSKIYMNNIY